MYREAVSTAQMAPKVIKCTNKTQICTVKALWRRHDVHYASQRELESTRDTRNNFSNILLICSKTLKTTSRLQQK